MKKLLKALLFVVLFPIIFAYLVYVFAINTVQRMEEDYFEGVA